MTQAGAARLVGTPAAPVPAGAVVEIFKGADGAPLRAALFPAENPRGAVILSPGRTEPIEKYFEVVGELRARGLTVLVHDWRGQGLSHRLLPDRVKGYAVGWQDYVADHRLLVSVFEDRLPAPRIALAHSMGGCLVALALADEPRIHGALFTAPMFAINLGKRPAWLAPAMAWTQNALGRGADYLPGQPSDPLHDQLKLMTHDTTRYARHLDQVRACPDLAIAGATWGWMAAALGAMAQANRPRTAAGIAVPLTILTGAEDRVVVNAPAAIFAARAPQGRHVEVPGSRHEIMMEVDAVRATFWREFDALAERVRRPSA